MKKSLLTLFVIVIICSCAGRQANLNSTQRIPSTYNNIVVFPFADPYFRGLELKGIGSSFAVAVANEISKLGKQCSVASATSVDITDIKACCEFSLQNEHDLVIMGRVTEWLDGATQWSGKVDVAALTPTSLT